MCAAEPGTSALLTDLYELTMALGYWRAGRAEQEAAFHLYFRTVPFRGGYTIACGLEPALEYLEALRFTSEDLDYLATLRGADESPLFPREFLDALGSMRLALDVDMVTEGTVVFPNEPLVRVRGPLLQAQDALPNNVVFLVDTYDTLDGVRHAIEVGRRLRAQGHRLLGVRLDSGDLAYLSIEARRLLDEAGFTDTQILATNELDEHVITSLKQQGAAITVWGVGTRLATAYDQPALGVVYKLTAIRDASGEWVPRVKVSEQAVKTTTPGLLQVRRYHETNADASRGGFSGDVLIDELSPPAPGDVTMVDPLDPTRRKRFAADCSYTLLLQPAMRAGTRVRQPEPLSAAQERARRELAAFHAGVKRLVNPHRYPVGLESGLHERKTALVLAARGTQE
ncbi:MAG: pncB2 [Geminicoccaceae bacterium]|nr:pncB2 [Geminicoccaceae bacterium]